MTVTILGLTLPVILPARHAEPHELVMTRFNSLPRGSAAQLGLCVPKLWEPTEKGGAGLALTFTYKSCGHDWYEFGARVWEVLHQAGVTDEAIALAAAPIDAELTRRVFPTQEEVTERVGFSDPTGGA